MDHVNPDHYTKGTIESIDAMEASMSKEEFQGYLKGNIQKYLWRWRDKGGVQDLHKAKWYLRRLIKSATEDEKDPDILDLHEMD